MAHRLVTQGDGLYAVFSTIVDDLIIYDCTAQDLEDFYVERAVMEARRDVQEWVAQESPGRMHHSIEEIIDEIRSQRGDNLADLRSCQLRGVPFEVELKWSDGHTNSGEVVKASEDDMSIEIEGEVLGFERDEDDQWYEVNNSEDPIVISRKASR